MAKQWFVGTTQQGRETWAKHNLENQGFGTYLPMCVSEWGSKPRVRPFLPSYIFIRLDAVSDRWRAVFSTFGMRTVLCSGEHPRVIPEAVVEEIMSREVDGLVRLNPKVQCKFKKGDKVVIRGNRSPLEVLFEEVDDAGRATLFFDMFGRVNSFKVPLAKLTAAPLAGVA